MRARGPRPGRDRAVGRRVRDGRSESGRQLYDLGVRLFTVGTGGPDYDLGQLRDWLAFRDDVNAR